MTATTTTTKKPAAKKAPAKKATTTKTSKLRYNVDGVAGLARTVVSRKSGTRMNIWFTAESKLFPKASKPWAVECEDHGKSKLCDTRAEARQHREDPASFCSGCKAAAKRTSTKKAA